MPYSALNGCSSATSTPSEEHPQHRRRFSTTSQGQQQRKVDATGFPQPQPINFYKLRAIRTTSGRHLDSHPSFGEHSQNLRAWAVQGDQARRIQSSVSNLSPNSPRSTCIPQASTTSPWDWYSKTWSTSTNRPDEDNGDHFTREVIQLMVRTCCWNARHQRAHPDRHRRHHLRPACGTGGMLAEAQNWIRATTKPTVKVFGRDYNPRSMPWLHLTC